MKVVVQRVTSASVTVAGEVIGAIGPGLVALVGIGAGDDEATVAWMVEKVCRLRIFAAADAPAGEGRFDRSLIDTGGELLSISQFTLHGDTHKGTRPSFTSAAHPDVARPLWERFGQLVAAKGVTVASGVFGASMQVALVNDGPVTIALER